MEEGEEKNQGDSQTSGMRNLAPARGSSEAAGEGRRHRVERRYRRVDNARLWEPGR